MGGLLCPRPLVQEAMKPFLSPAGLLGVEVLAENRREDSVRALADIFDVNPAVTRIRINELFPPRNRANAPLKILLTLFATVGLHCTELW